MRAFVAGGEGISSIRVYGRVGMRQRTWATGLRVLVSDLHVELRSTIRARVRGHRWRGTLLGCLFSGNPTNWGAYIGGPRFRQLPFFGSIRGPGAIGVFFACKGLGLGRLLRGHSLAHVITFEQTTFLLGPLES